MSEGVSNLKNAAKAHEDIVSISFFFFSIAFVSLLLRYEATWVGGNCCNSLTVMSILGKNWFAFAANFSLTIGSPMTGLGG